MTRRLIVALSGASGQIYAIRLLEVLRADPQIETHLVISDAARLTIAQETDLDVHAVESLADVVYPVDDIRAAIASGSFETMGMVVIPCSIKTLSAVATSYSANLVARAADVQLKQGRPVLLVVRETPLHVGHLRLMVQATEIGCVIMPPVPAFYGRPKTLDDVITRTVGRILARLGIDNALYSEWPGAGTRTEVEPEEPQ